MTMNTKNNLKRINESEEKQVDHYEEADKLISKLRADIKKLATHFKSMGVNEQTKYKDRNPLAVLDEIDATLHGFDRTKSIFNRSNELPSTNPSMVQNRKPSPKLQEIDNPMNKPKPAVKMGEKSDTTMKKKVSDFAKKYDMDVQMVDEITEGVLRSIIGKI